MTGFATPEPMFEFEAFGVAFGSAAVCGLLSAFVPWLIAPTATLSALAVAGWVSRMLRRGALSWKRLSPGTLASLGVLGGAAAGFLDPPAPLGFVRGLILAAGLVPLFAVDRLSSGPRPPSFSEA